MNDSAVQILGVAGSRLDIIGTVELSIQVFDRIIRHKFYVKTGKLTFGCHFIFGIDLIHHYRLVYHPTTKAVTFLDPIVASCMTTFEPKRLSKRRRKRVRFLLSPNDDPPSCGYFDHLTTTDATQAFIYDDERHFSLFVSKPV